MAGNKGKLIEISDLQLKVNFLCEIFEKEKLIQNISNQTLNNWRHGKRKPAESTLNKFLEPLGISRYQFELSMEKFAEYISDQITGCAHDDIPIILESLYQKSTQKKYPASIANTTENTHPFVLLKNTRTQINIEALEHDFERFKGFYWLYTYWATFEENRITKKIFANI